jgi:hypothetical protein
MKSRHKRIERMMEKKKEKKRMGIVDINKGRASFVCPVT